MLVGSFTVSQSKKYVHWGASVQDCNLFAIGRSSELVAMAGGLAQNSGQGRDLPL